jgi:hypothetical protein
MLAGGSCLSRTPPPSLSIQQGKAALHSEGNSNNCTARHSKVPCNPLEKLIQARCPNTPGYHICSDLCRDWPAHVAQWATHEHRMAQPMTRRCGKAWVAEVPPAQHAYGEGCDGCCSTHTPQNCGDSAATWAVPLVVGWPRHTNSLSPASLWEMLSHHWSDTLLFRCCCPQHQGTGHGWQEPFAVTHTARSNGFNNRRRAAMHNRGWQGTCSNCCKEHDSQQHSAKVPDHVLDVLRGRGWQCWQQPAAVAGGAEGKLFCGQYCVPNAHHHGNTSGSTHCCRLGRLWVCSTNWCLHRHSRHGFETLLRMLCPSGDRTAGTLDTDGNVVCLPLQQAAATLKRYARSRERERELRAGWPRGPECLACGLRKGGDWPGASVLVQRVLPRPLTSMLAACSNPSTPHGNCLQVAHRKLPTGALTSTRAHCSCKSRSC